jgi:hypothetical protein
MEEGIMDRRWAWLLAVGLMATLVSGCPTKAPTGPPQDLLDRIAAAEAAFGKAAAYSPGGADAAKYEQRLAEARRLRDAGNYPAALKEARLAEVAAVRLNAELIDRKLGQAGTPPSLTYGYRQNLKKSEDAEAAGDLDGALNYAREALKQISALLTERGDCVTAGQAELIELKEQIEQLYRPANSMITAYWDASDAIAAKNCEKIASSLDKVSRQVADYRRTYIMMTPMFTITATREYTKQFGDPYLYGEVTKDGFLGKRQGQVPVGATVTFVKSLLYSRDKTYYYVRDEKFGQEGWVAEDKVWPDRTQH